MKTIIRSLPIEFFQLKYTQDIDELKLFVNANSFHRCCNTLYLFIKSGGSLEVNFTDYVMKIGNNFIVFTEEEFNAL